VGKLFTTRLHYTKLCSSDHALAIYVNDEKR